MMDYLRSLTPHKIKETVSINDVRQKIIDLTKPLAEIAKLIETTTSNMEDQMEEIKNSEDSAEEIKQRINITVWFFLCEIV